MTKFPGCGAVFALLPLVLLGCCSLLALAATNDLGLSFQHPSSTSMFVLFLLQLKNKYGII
jgi:hypothetical protein